MTTIENNLLCLQVNLQGAELSSVFNKKNNTEYLWQAESQFWGRHAPVLFPIVGRLKDDTFTYQGENYELGQHGFARNFGFKLTEQTDNSASFVLSSKSRTLKQFPFHFNLKITYTLIENTVKVDYQVVNTYHTPLYFSIGGHPGFNCPLHKDEKRSDYQLVFNLPETQDTQLIIDGLRSGKNRPVLDNETTVPLTDELFDNDALIFQNLNSNEVSLQKGDEKIVSFDFSGFPYLGIWSKNRNSPFVCIEPWFGIADVLSHDQDITQKEGIICLQATENFNCSYSFTIC